MSFSAAAERWPTGSESTESVDGNEPVGIEARLHREPIIRLVEDLPPDVAGSTGAQQRQSSLGTSFGNSENVDFGKTPARRPDLASLQATLHALQEWEGYVVGIGTATFEARLLDVTAGARYDSEEATIPLQEIAYGDREGIRVGSIFRWVIGHERSPAGSKRRVSQIVFRDLPAVTATDERDGRAWARKVMDKFGP